MLQTIHDEQNIKNLQTESSRGPRKYVPLYIYFYIFVNDNFQNIKVVEKIY